MGVNLKLTKKEFMLHLQSQTQIELEAPFIFPEKTILKNSNYLLCSERMKMRKQSLFTRRTQVTLVVSL